ncbi:MAG: hypothetical protein EOM20_10860 [Spartobacteria bacterium]|nr:hypothetical protein [Spartobacteria bacterium]
MKKKIVLKKPVAADEESGIAERGGQDSVHPQLITRRISPPPPRIVSTREAIEQAKQKEPETFKFYCIRCGQKLQVQTAWVGREVSCSTCGRQIVIPPPP